MLVCRLLLLLVPGIVCARGSWLNLKFRSVPILLAQGLIVGGTICYDCNLPEIVRDTVFKGAELVIRIQG